MYSNYLARNKQVKKFTYQYTLIGYKAIRPIPYEICVYALNVTREGYDCLPPP